MKFNLKGLNLNMLLLVAIFVGVVVVFLRQNNKCMMDEDDDDDDVVEGFISKMGNGMYNIPNKKFKTTNSPYLYYGANTYTHKPKNSRHHESKYQTRLRAMNDCIANTMCIGLEMDRSGSRQIRQVLMNSNPNGLYYNGRLSNDAKYLIYYLNDPRARTNTNFVPSFNKYIKPTNRTNRTNIIMKGCLDETTRTWC